MANDRQEAGQQSAPANPNDESFGMNEDDFYVDPDTGDVFIGDTSVVGKGRRVRVEQAPPQQAVDEPQQAQGDDKFGLTEEDFSMDKDGNVDIGEFRVQEERIDNTDPIKTEFEKSRLTPDQREEIRQDIEEKRAREAAERKPPVTPQEEYRLKVLDEEHVIKDKNELLNLAQKGLRADQKFQELAEMRKEIEPFYQISLRMKDDPAFVQHVKAFGQPNYQIDGPEPVIVHPDQFSNIVEERVSNQMQAQRIYWEHDAKYKGFKDYPKADEVRQKLLSDSLHWDKFTRDWVDKNPVAYADKFQQTSQKLIREKNLDPSPAIPIPPRVIERQKAVLEQLRAKEVSKEKARVESAKTTADVQIQDGRLALARARKRAAESGSVTDWADVIEKMGLAD